MSGSGLPDKESVSGGSSWGKHAVVRFLLLLFLVAVVALEGYYIFVLRDNIERQTEELRDISMQLQSSKNESTDLREELSSMKKMAGEGRDGNTADRQR